MSEPRETVPLDEFSVEHIQSGANPFGSFNPEGAVCRRAAELTRGIAEVENRFLEASGADYMRAAYDRLSLDRNYQLLRQFAYKAGVAMRRLTPAEATVQTAATMRTEIEQAGGDPKEAKDRLVALSGIERLFREEFPVSTTGALPDSSAD